LIYYKQIILHSRGGKMNRIILNLDSSLVFRSKELAAKIVENVFEYIDSNSTKSIERTVLRFFGIDGVNEEGVPLSNIVVNQLFESGIINLGASYWISNACVALKKSPQEVAELVAKEGFKLSSVSLQPIEEIKKYAGLSAGYAVQNMEKTRNYRNGLLENLKDPDKPYNYVIVATGNIYEDVIQAQAAARQGADIIAVIRSTAQSLLDYVPYGPTTEGFGGTYATQENFRIMRKALDEVSQEQNRYIRLVNYASGLCMPEIAMMAAWEGLDFLLNDSMYGILFRDINMKRTFIDQYFSRLICAFSNITINTGEDNYLTTSDAIEKAHSVTSSQLINEAFAKKAGMEEKLMGLGHAFEINPDIKNGLLYEIAHAALARELFPNATLKYMPPTKHITGNIFKGYAMNTMYNFVSVLTGQDIQLLGMLTEAIHTPFLQDRYLALLNSKYIFNNSKDIGKEFIFSDDGFIRKRANEVLNEAVIQLEHVESIGIMKAIAEGQFAEISRPVDGGKGLAGVFEKDDNYFNPILDSLTARLGLGE